MPQVSSDVDAALRASVIVPTWDLARRQHLALQTLKNLSQQRGAGYEVLVVENGTDGNLTSAARELQQRFSSFRFYSISSCGIAGARNVGAREARSNILIYIDDDIIVSPRLVEAFRAAHERPGRYVLQGDLEFEMDAECRSESIARQAEEQAAWTRKLRTTSYQYCGRDFAAGFFSIKRDLLMQLGGFDEQFDPYDGGEIDLAVRMEKAGLAFIYEKAASGRHLNTGTEKDFFRKARLSGCTYVRLIRKHGCEPLQLRDCFVVRGFTVPRAMWGRRIMQHVPGTYSLVRFGAGMLARIPGMRSASMKMLDYRVKQFEALWQGALEVLSWSDLQSLIQSCK